MLNATLFGQMITFSIFAWVVMKYIMPQVNSALDSRENEIANGLKAASEGKSMLAKAAVKVEKLLADAKSKVALMFKEAEHQANQIIANAKKDAVTERQKQVGLAEKDIEQLTNKIRQELKLEVADIVKVTVEKLLQQKVSENINNRLLEELIVDTEEK